MHAAAAASLAAGALAWSPVEARRGFKIGGIDSNSAPGFLVAVKLLQR